MGGLHPQILGTSSVLCILCIARFWLLSPMMRRMIPSGRVFVSFLSRRLIYWVVFGFLNIVESIVTFFARL